MATPNPTHVILAAAGIQSPHNAPTPSWPPQIPLPSSSPLREPKALTMRQHRDGRAELHCRQCRRSGNPRPLQCANTVMAAPNLTPVILAAVGIQSPYNAPTRSWPRRTPLPSCSPQRESGAPTMRQYGHGRAEPHSRHARRSGNPRPLQCANTVMAAPNPTPVILTAVGIQSPHNAPTRSWPRRTSLPSFSPQRESRALTMRQHRHGRAEPHSRHSRRSGNPEPIQCANTVMAARRTPLPSFSPQRESRAHTMRQHGHGRAELRCRQCHRSGPSGDSVIEVTASRSRPRGRTVVPGRFPSGSGLDT